jgi:hypothetical protein
LAGRGSRGVFVFFLALDLAGGVPFAHLGGVGLSMALALATSRLAQVLVTCHLSQVIVFELGCSPPEERGDSGGNLRSVRGEFI